MERDAYDKPQQDEAPSVGSGVDSKYQQSMAREWEAKKAVESGVTLENVEEVFTYHAPSREQMVQYEMVREAMILAARTILRVVPRCADRTTAIRKLREARMDANAAIALQGRI